MMTKYILFGLLAIFSLCFLGYLLKSDKGPYIVLNMENKAVLPRNFRMSTTPLPKSIPNPPSTLGLAELHISGSAQFSEKSLRKLFETIPGWNIVVFDLREEPHGFLNGNAISWFVHKNWLNEHLTLQQIEDDQHQRLENLSRKNLVIIYKDKNIPYPVFVKTVASEKELVEDLGMRYIRYKARDHVKPYEESVDEFIELVKGMPKDVWLHFHCSAGRGRTTTFMVMYDMMKNAQNVSMEDIIERHYLLGGVNLLSAPSPEVWKHPYAVERSEFIQQFYRYCKENPSFTTSWSDWLKKNRT